MGTSLETLFQRERNAFGWFGKTQASGAVPTAIKYASRIASMGRAVSKGLTLGKNAKGHLIKHADVLGYGGYSAQQLQRMLPELESALKNLFSQMKLKRIGQWSGFQNAKFFTGNGKMIVTQSDGTFITTINKTSNAWFQKAIPIK